MKHNLSKSSFIRGLQCHKSLWLYKNKPELRTKPDASQQAVFESGTEVGILAQGLFPDGKEVKFEGSTPWKNTKLTQELINNGVDTIYEATFTYDSITVMVDILHKGSDGWGLYEVKGSSGFKEVYLNDISVQYYVVTGSGLNLNSASLVHLNSDYVRNGELSISELFTIQNITQQVVDQQEFIMDKLAGIRSMLDGGSPDIDIGPHCFTPYRCDFFEHCRSHIPEYSVFDIAGLYTTKKFDLYNRGIVNLQDIPEDYPLSDSQWLQVEAELNDTILLECKDIKDFLKTLYYPLYYLDFETFTPAVPPFDNTKPYQQIPFQFSLHLQEKEGAEPKHYEFLAEEGREPRMELIKELIRLIPDNVCVIAYNSGFEKRILRELGEAFPEYANKLAKIQNNIIDIMKPFQNKHYYTKELKGSYSIKAVLPALVPELSYQGMVIADGGEAMRAYASLHLIEDEDEKKKIRKDLLEYCKLDTLGMVKIVAKLNEVI
jgi:hypothetical protein